MSKHWLFSFIDSTAGDGTLCLINELRSDAQEEADRICGYQKLDRVILHAQETVKVITLLLESVC